MRGKSTYTCCHQMIEAITMDLLLPMAACGLGLYSTAPTRLLVLYCTVVVKIFFPLLLFLIFWGDFFLLILSYCMSSTRPKQRAWFDFYNWHRWIEERGRIKDRKKYETKTQLKLCDKELILRLPFFVIYRVNNQGP